MQMIWHNDGSNQRVELAMPILDMIQYDNLLVSCQALPYDSSSDKVWGSIEYPVRQVPSCNAEFTFSHRALRVADRQECLSYQ